MNRFSEIVYLCIIILISFTSFLEGMYKSIPSGLASVFKPKGWSSSAVVLKLRWVLSTGYKERTGQKVKIKVGHGGTLDPLAEGVLVIGIGHGTKLMDQYLGGSKKYLAVAKFGSETDTLDCTGNVTQVADCSHITYNTIEQHLPKFRGEIKQTPPMFSALKKDGKKLYELAREGIEIERKSRDVSVYDLNLVNHHFNSQSNQYDIPIELPKFGLSISSSGGFYVRSLISDLARECQGLAHMTDLVRVQQGDFKMEDCLRENEWDYDTVCEHIVKSSKIVGISVHDLPPAVPAITTTS